MCLRMIYVDRYTNYDKISDEDWTICSYGNNREPWECENYWEEDHIQCVREMRESPRSSCSHSRRAPSFVGVPERTSSVSSSQRPRHSGRKSFTGLVMNAFFDPPRTHQRSRSPDRSTIFFHDEPIPDHRCQTPPSLYRGSTRATGPSRRPSSPVSPISPSTPIFSNFETQFDGDPVIVEASPCNRGRSVIIDDGRCNRPTSADSVEVHVTTSRTMPRERAQPPIPYDERLEQEGKAAEELRCRCRNAEAARLEHKIHDLHARRRRAHEQQLHDDAIRARPARPIVVDQESPRRPVMRTASPRRTAPRPTRDSDVNADMGLSRRGEDIILTAMRDKDREDEQDRRETVADDERRRRMSQPFPGPRDRRGQRSERIVWEDDSYR